MTSVCKIMLQVWRKVAQDERKTREYFEKLERGEDAEEMDVEVKSKDSRLVGFKNVWIQRDAEYRVPLCVLSNR